MAAMAGEKRLMVSSPVKEDGGDFRTGEEVLHVAVGLVQLLHLPLQLGVDRDQFLVQGLQLFLGGLQLLVGGLQLFVGGLDTPR